MTPGNFWFWGFIRCQVHLRSLVYRGGQLIVVALVPGGEWTEGDSVSSLQAHRSDPSPAGCCSHLTCLVAAAAPGPPCLLRSPPSLRLQPFHRTPGGVRDAASYGVVTSLGSLNIHTGNGIHHTGPLDSGALTHLPASQSGVDGPTQRTT